MRTLIIPRRSSFWMPSRRLTSSWCTAGGMGKLKRALEGKAAADGKKMMVCNPKNCQAVENQALAVQDRARHG